MSELGNKYESPVRVVRLGDENEYREKYQICVGEGKLTQRRALRRTLMAFALINASAGNKLGY